MSKQKRNNKESMICFTLKPSQSFFIYCIQSKEKFLQKKSFLRKKDEVGGGLNKKMKRRLFNCFHYGD